MKIKSLPINVLAVLFGVSAFFISPVSNANNAANSLAFEQSGEELRGTQVNMSDVVAARKQAASVQTKGKSSLGLTWEFRGANNLGGPVSAIVVDSRDDAKKTVYAGTKHGGIWKSLDGGTTWAKMPTPNNENLFVSALTQSVFDNAIYAGTGLGRDFPGQGIYKCTDGNTFILVPGSEEMAIVYKIAAADNGRLYAATDAGLYFYDGSSWTVCSGTRNGRTVNINDEVRDVLINEEGLVVFTWGTECYISTTMTSDGFVSNTFVSDPDVVLSSVAVAVAPSNSNVIYVSAAAGDGTLEGAYLSEDKGGSWRKVFAKVSYPYPDNIFTLDPLDENGKNVNQIYVDDSNPYIIYIVSQSVWKGQKFSEDGYYDFGLSALSGSLHSGINDVQFFTTLNDSEGIKQAYVATDGGVTLCNIYTQYNAFSAAPKNKTLNITSMNYISVNSAGNVLGGTPTFNLQMIGEGTNYYQHARSAWALTSEEENYINEGVGGPSVISLINEDFYIYSGMVPQRYVDYGYTSERYDLRRSDTKGRAWQSRAAWMQFTPSSNAPFLMWENFEGACKYDSVWFKADSTNHKEENMYIVAKSKNYEYPFIHVLDKSLAIGDSIQVVDQIQNRFYLSMGGSIGMTMQALDLSRTSLTSWPEWYAIANLDGFVENESITCMTISVNGDHLFVGTSIGKVFRISNLLEAYNEATADVNNGDDYKVKSRLIGTYGNRRVASIAVNPNNANHVVVTFQDYNTENVYESNDALADAPTFNSVHNESLPKLPVYSSLIVEDAVLIGTHAGLYTKGSGQDSWTKDGSITGGSVINNPVYALKQVTTFRPGVYDSIAKVRYPHNYSNYGGIYASVYGSGIYYADKYVSIEPVEPGTPSASGQTLTVMPNPTSDIARFEFDLKSGSSARVQMFDISGRCVLDQTATSSIHTINMQDYATGMYLIRLTQGTDVKMGKVIKR